MSVIVLVGCDFGDEGKGKIIDQLSEQVDIVARYQGGANAGHTVVIGDKEYVLHLVPSGIFHDHVTCVIGNGVVIDPIALNKEINGLRDANINVNGRLWVSSDAHLILPYHKAVDEAVERSAGIGQIGTTKRGIGPAYVDKAMRIGVRFGDLKDRDVWTRLVCRNTSRHNQTLRAIHRQPTLDADDIISELELCVQGILPLCNNTQRYLYQALCSKKLILAEGAQGAHLDMDHGTYPFVTSSNPTSGGACTGLGIPPTAITSVIGVVKAYSTRVGNGPFPTKLTGDLGELIQQLGNEYGATTKRKRDCGWLNLPALHYACMINGVTELVVTKLDVLDTLPSIEVCTDLYSNNDGNSVNWPWSEKNIASGSLHMRRFDGWLQKTSDIRQSTSVPSKMYDFLNFISDYLRIPISMISVGRERGAIIKMD